MPKLTLTDILSGYATADAYNANNALIEAAFENTLSRDGTVPNEMQADIDMDSFAINNLQTINMTGLANIVGAKSVSTTALVLNGEAITTQTTLTGGLDASEVTYDGSDLTTKLDGEFLKNNENGSLTGTLTVSGLLTASAGLDVTTGDLDVLAGDLNVTGAGTLTGDLTISTGDLNMTAGAINAQDIEVSGALSVGGESQPVAPAQNTQHIRAGSIQLLSGGTAETDIDIEAVVTTDTWETIGPTGSGADNIWATMDQIPDEATGIIVSIEYGYSPTGSGGCSLDMFAHNADEGSGGGTGVSNRIIKDVLNSGNVNGDSKTNVHPFVIIPIGAAKDFLVYWTSSLADTISIDLEYRGFVTD